MPGPPPNPNARRRNVKTRRVLPKAGRVGELPEWPLDGQSPSEARKWRKLWKLPVATVWDDQEGYVDVVARYVRQSVIIELSLAEGEYGVVARLGAQLITMEDRLGLTPIAMARLECTVGEPQGAPAPGVKVANLDDRRALYGT